MATSRLRLEFPGATGPLIPGTMIQGTLSVQGGGPVPAGFVGIRFRGETEVKGVAKRWEEERVLIDLPPLGGDGSPALSVRLPVPEGPPTYMGRNFATRWAIVATFEASSSDPGAVLDVAMGVKPGSGGVARSSDKGGFELGCAVFMVLLLLVACGAALLWREFTIVSVIAWLCAAVLFLICLGVVPWARRVRRMGHANLEAGPDPVPRGDSLACSVVITPKPGVRVGAVRASLEATEEWKEGEGEEEKSDSEVVARLETVLESGDTPGAAGRYEYAGLIEIPADAPPSVHAGAASLEWVLTCYAREEGSKKEVNWSMPVKVA